MEATTYSRLKNHIYLLDLRQHVETSEDTSPLPLPTTTLTTTLPQLYKVITKFFFPKNINPLEL